MPPLAPPYGKLITEHLIVIRQAKASTYAKSTFYAYLVPPLVGSL